MRGLMGLARDLDMETGLGTGVMVALRLRGLVELSAEGSLASAGRRVTGEGRSLVTMGVENRVIGGTLVALMKAPMGGMFGGGDQRGFLAGVLALGGAVSWGGQAEEELVEVPEVKRQVWQRP